MIGKNLKITAKLAISAAAFLLPLGIMLSMTISSSYTGIKKEKKELAGIEVIRPAVSLIQIIPQYIRYSVDKVHGDYNFTLNYSQDLLNELITKYEAHFGSEDTVISIESLKDYWEHISKSTNTVSVIWTYSQLIQDLCTLVAYIGDISGLITDSEIESTYLISATIHELPQVQKRIVLIGNILRTVNSGAFTERRKAELMLNLELLVHADNIRIENRVNSAVALGISGTETSETFENLLKICHDRITYYSNAVEYFINLTDMNPNAVSALSETEGQANNAAYRLQDASLDMLENFISAKINRYKTRLIWSLITVFISTLAAFVIVFITYFGIRKSTNSLDFVFKSLDKNDLTIQVQSLSNDELGHFITSLNTFLEKLKTAFSSFNRNASMISTAIYEISSSAKEITTTANEQSTNVAEIISTMENNKNLSAQTAEKTVEVADLAARTQELSQRGADLRNFNEEMMLNILKQNLKIIDEIKNLADILSHIDESVQLIDTIADHIKLIAFNAALEASSSGEAGSRFAVVAGEIRRFADNVAESISEIKEKISELQNANQSLITEANNGSRAIDSGYNRMVEQKEVFENIVEASQNVAVRSQQISGLSRQQELASEQIFSALKEISAGVSQFITVTSSASATAENLNRISKELKETLAKYTTKNGGMYDR
jgi:methyl-accepting chemotaxis protein